MNNKLMKRAVSADDPLSAVTSSTEREKQTRYRNGENMYVCRCAVSHSVVRPASSPSEQASKQACAPAGIIASNASQDAMTTAPTGIETSTNSTHTTDGLWHVENEGVLALTAPKGGNLNEPLYYFFVRYSVARQSVADLLARPGEEGSNKQRSALRTTPCLYSGREFHLSIYIDERHPLFSAFGFCAC